jgi:plasmid stability protein
MFVHSQTEPLVCAQHHLRSKEEESVEILTQVTRLERHTVLPLTACHLLYNLSIGIVSIQEQSLDRRNI